MPLERASTLALDRARFLARASRLLAQSLDYETTLATVARLAMPELGAWCIVDVIDPDAAGQAHQIRRITITHPDPAKQELVHELERGYPPEVEDLLGAPAALRSHQPVLVANVTSDMLQRGVRNERHRELLHALGIDSYIVAPMEARERVVGCITFISASSSQQYDEADLLVAEELASIGAMAIENARLYRVAQRAREEVLDFGIRTHSSERAKGDFLATMSHELRTPLNAVLGYAELLSSGVAGPLTDDQHRYLERQRNATRHLLSLVNDVLDVAKIESNDLPVSRERFNVRAAIRSAIAMVLPQAKSRRVRIQIDLESTRTVLAHVHGVGDSRRARQVLANLLANAVRFSPEGDTVDVSVIRSDRGTDAPDGMVAHGDSSPMPASASASAREVGWIGVRVRDRGIGIEETDHERVFEPFVQLNPGGLVRPLGGTGLGLTISRRLARLMGGDVTLDSHRGEGATLTLWLPMMDETTAPAEHPHGRAAGDAHPEPNRQRRRGRARYSAGIGIIGDAMLSQIDDIVMRYVERVRTDPDIPAAHGAQWTEISNHTATLLSDIAHALGVMEESEGRGTPLMRMGADIRSLVAERRARRRAQLGWTSDALDRDFAILLEEVQRAVREHAPADAGASLDAALYLIQRFLDDSRRVGIEAFEREVARL